MSLDSRDTIYLSVNELEPYQLYMSTDEFKHYLDKKIWENKTYVGFPEYRVNEWKRQKAIDKLNNERLSLTVEMNQQGKDYEKAERIEDAIFVYENNIKLKYPAPHAYVRLMILYRKLKRYEDEIRVIKVALEVFGKKNEDLFNSLINNPNYSKYKNELQDAHETNTDFRGDEQFYIYKPFPVSKWISRMDKANELLTRINRK